MSWKRLFAREMAQGRPRSNNDAVSRHVLIEPRNLLLAHRSRLNALRLESAYDAAQFERLVESVLLQVAEWVYFLSATRAENHRESGGLLRFAVETATLAFRRADGKFLSGQTTTDVRSRERDRVWRYVAFLGGLLRPLGRCATLVHVSTDQGVVWNPLLEGLWQWHRRIEATNVEIHWRAGADGQPTSAATGWVAARIIPANALSYLHGADASLAEVLLRTLSGDATGRLCEVVEQAYQAAIDQDLASVGAVSEAMVPGVRIEHRLLEALRALCREKWTMNTPGGRVWCTDCGVYIVWKAAANDLLVRMRADGVVGVPRDPDTLAELLAAHGVLTPNPNVTAGLKHYYKLVPQLRGVPRQTLEVVKIADTELIGLQLQGVDRIPAELVGALPEAISAPLASPPAGASASAVPAPAVLSAKPRSTKRDPGPESKTLQLPLEEARGAGSTASVELPPLPAPQRAAQIAVEPVNAINLEPLKRFGSPGLTLQKLALGLTDGSVNLSLKRVADGIAIEFPESIAALGADPQEFVTSCEAQGLLVPDKAGGRRFVRARTPDQSHLPPQYIVLAQRVARYLPNTPGDLM
ncbi:MobH family relaxase [Steroidobacter sp.]|uniref:MobH family relaxase n=1 Tax=Steroidobacter sp. TaxID=1978227 RepID=UPI001A4A70EB|nr:MobH family relaxase [Steroidobacter sp.]MBL8268708.1 TraI domain-containing protein [Steroidobacter sp.]